MDTIDELAIPEEIRDEVELLRPDDANLPTWYLGVLAELAGHKAALDEHVKALYGRLETRRRALEYKCGRRFREQVDRDLSAQRGSKKSVTYATGRAGFRAKKSTIIIEVAADALAWAMRNCPDAVDPHIARKTPLIELANNGTEIPGCRFVPAREDFYPKTGENDDE